MIRLAPLEVDDAERAAAVLTPAFAADPTLRWCFDGDAPGYADRLRGYLQVGHRWHRGGGQPVQGAFADGELVGACYLADPGIEPAEADVRALEAALVEACGAPAAVRFAAYNRDVEAASPPGRHHVLAIVGVHPRRQGRGAGRALVEWACDRSDADPASDGVVLDTGNAENLRFYARFGFETVARVPLGGAIEHVLRRPPGGSGPGR